MNFKKIVLDDMVRCYCASSIIVNGELNVILASEEIDGPCYAYSGNDFSKKTVIWEKAGGTMSFVPVPNTNGEFLAVQKFFPGFKSEGAKIVWGRYDDKQGWIIQDLIHLPFVHRFEILQSNDELYLIAATLCGSKKDREDWSDPGKVYVAKLPANLNNPINLEVLAENLTKNHGFWKVKNQSHDYCYITSDEGIFEIHPPSAENGWSINNIMQKPVSEVAVFDLDEDGTNEFITIEPFHGDTINIYKNNNIVYTYPNKINFAHTLWAGLVRGKPMAFGGIRRENMELFYITYDKESNAYISTVLEQGGGPANLCVVNTPDYDILVCANHTKNEAALYLITD